MLAAVLLVGWSVALCVSDLRALRLPNVLTLGGAAAIILTAAALGNGPGAVCGGSALSALYLTVHLLAPGGLGAGDVKLAIAVGALTGSLGAGAWALAALGAPLLTAAAGAAAAARGRPGPIPHGPSMVLASLAAAGLAVS